MKYDSMTQRALYTVSQARGGLIKSHPPTNMKYDSMTQRALYTVSQTRGGLIKSHLSAIVPITARHVKYTLLIKIC